jgi:adenylate cyclase
VENDLPKAIDYLETLTSLYPDDTSARNNRGWFLFQLGRYEDAVEEYQQAIRSDPYLMLSYDGLSRIYLYHLGEVGKAMALCEEQITRNDRAFHAYGCIGWASIAGGDLERAGESFEQAVEINPRFSLYQFQLGHTYRMQGRYEEAVEVFLRILEVDPGYTWQAYYDAGATCQVSGDEDSAEKYLRLYHEQAEKWLENDPDNPSSYYLMGLVLTRLGEIERGWSIGRKVIEMDPSRHFAFAELLAVQGKKQEALDRLERAVEEGYQDYIWIKANVNFVNLHDEPRFQNLLTTYLK